MASKLPERRPPPLAPYGASRRTHHVPGPSAGRRNPTPPSAVRFARAPPGRQSRNRAQNGPRAIPVAEAILPARTHLIGDIAVFAARAAREHDLDLATWRAGAAVRAPVVAPRAHGGFSARDAGRPMHLRRVRRVPNADQLHDEIARSSGVKPSTIGRAVVLRRRPAATVELSNADIARPAKERPRATARGLTPSAGSADVIDSVPKGREQGDDGQHSPVLVS